MSRPVPRLHLIGPLVLDASAYPAIAEAALRGGCDAVHVRMPGGQTDEMVRLARALRERITYATLIVNDRIDIALVAGADGVQLGEHSFSPSDARRIIGDRLLIGRSVHDIDVARRAEDDGADYLLAGHVFDTDSKAGEPGRGLEWLASLCAAVEIPVIAIGGVSVERIPLVVEAGAHGVALGRELLRADDPETSARTAMAAITGGARAT